MALSSALFDTSVGLVVNKDRVEAGKLRESDVQREIDNIQLQLNALVRSVLFSSITFFREGLLYLFKLRNKGSTGENHTEMAQSGAIMEDKQVVVYTASTANPMSKVSRSLKELKITDLEDADKRALSAAKEDFKEARIRAVEAFSNDTLNPSDRIRAMFIRVAATMLENIDHPEDAVGVCVSCLEELHALPEVQESFSVEIYKGYKYNFYKDSRRQIIFSVCRLNRDIRNVAIMFAKEGELLSFPLIDIGVEKIDPLHDQRVAEILGKLNMPHCAVPPLTLGQMDEKTRKVKIPQGVAANSQGHFIVGDEWDRTVKIFDSNGNFQPEHTLRFSIGSASGIVSIGDVATDRDDNVYVLLEKQEKSGTERFKICVFDNQGNTKHDFFLREEAAEVLRMTVNNNDEVLVLARSFENQNTSLVEVYESDGRFKGRFGEEVLHCAQDICATSDGRIIVLDKDEQGDLSVQVFRSNQQDTQFNFQKSVEKVKKVITKSRSSIACHQVGHHVLVIAVPSEISHDGKVEILKYDLDVGEFLPSIALPMEGLVSTRGIAVTVEGRVAVGLLDKSGGDSKVLVV